MFLFFPTFFPTSLPHASISFFVCGPLSLIRVSCLFINCLWSHRKGWSLKGTFLIHEEILAGPISCRSYADNLSYCVPWAHECNGSIMSWLEDLFLYTSLYPLALTFFPPLLLDGLWSLGSTTTSVSFVASLSMKLG